MKIAAIDKKTSEGKKRFDIEINRIRLKGNFYHNLKVLKCGGSLKVMRRPGPEESVDHKNFTPCVHCLGFVLKNDLWRHTAICPLNEKRSLKEDSEQVHRSLQHESDLLLFGMQEGSSSALREAVISKMRSDKISFVAKRDELIMLYANALFEKTGSAKANYTSEKMRTLARLLITLQEEAAFQSCSLQYFIAPERFDDVIKAVRAMCSYSQEEDQDHIASFKKPSLALKIGHALKKCAMLMRGMALRKKDKDLKETGEAFVELIESEWSTKVSAAAIRTLNENTFNKQPVLPLTSDLVKLREFLLHKIPVVTAMLKNEPSVQNWRHLSELTASGIIVFNKRCGNEGTKMEIKQFIERPSWNEHSMEEVSKSLQPMEIQLCQRYCHFLILTSVALGPSKFYNIQS